MKLLITAVLFLGLANLSAASTEEANSAHLQTTQVLNESGSWSNIRIKQVLKHRMIENQFMLAFISDHHDQLSKTEIDSNYNDAVESLLKDQAGLIYILEHLSKVDSIEQLNLDEYFSDHVSFANDVEATLAQNLEAWSGKALVDRVLYYSSVKKYPVI